VSLTVLVTFSWLIGAFFAQGSRPDVQDLKLIAEGDAVFAKSCSIPYCHGKEGTAGRAPALNNRKWEIAQLHQVILKGVPNSSMPNWDDKLSEREIWAAVARRGLRSWVKMDGLGVEATLQHPGVRTA
jgi:mono/diheme cytochrome c family protein